MTEYYVAPFGNDGDPGTKANPCLTIQKGCDIAQPGDFVIVLEGQYEERVQVNGAGSPGMMVTIQADGLVVMKGFTILADWVTVRYFEITDTPNAYRNGNGVFIKGDHCLVEENYIHFTTRGGIMIETDMADHSSNCVIRKNKLYRNAHNGIEVHGRNHLIESNDVWGTIQHHPKWEPLPSWVDADGMRFHGSGHVFRKNRIWGIHYSDPLISNAHIDCFQSQEIVGSQEPASNILFEQNYCEALTSQNENESGHCFMVSKASDIIIRNNVLKAYFGINAFGGSNNLTIVNNLFVNDLSFQQFYPTGVGLGDVKNAVVKNNIFYDQPFYTISVNGDTTGHDIDHNLAYRSDGQPSDCYKINWLCVDPPPPNDLWDIDPMFRNPSTDNYRLQNGSPAIDSGITIPEVVDDYEGNPRPQGIGYDIGPSEYMEGNMGVRSVDAINISNWQETGKNVSIPQYQFDIEVLWTDQGEKHQHNATYRYPNDIASMPIFVRKRYAEEMIIAVARVKSGIDEWERYG